MADHLRSARWLIEAGVRPSNTDQGYVLRRLIRRAVRQAPGHDLGSDDPVIRDEQRAFAGTLKRGLRELERLEHPTGRDLFRLFETHGFPPELAGVQRLGGGLPRAPPTSTASAAAPAPSDASAERAPHAGGPDRSTIVVSVSAAP